MKRALCLVLAVTLFFSFAVVGYATIMPTIYNPVLYYGYSKNSNPTNLANYELISSGAIPDASGLSFNDYTFPQASSYLYQYMEPFQDTFNTPGYLYIWFISDLTLEGIAGSDLEQFYSVDIAKVSGTTWGSGSNYGHYVSTDGNGRYIIQNLVGIYASSQYDKIRVGWGGVFPSGVTVKTNNMYYQYADSSSTTPPINPDDPLPDLPGGGDDGPMSPPTQSDQWVSEQYSGAVNPDLAPKIEEAYSAAETVDTFEQDMWSELDKYSADVNPDNFTFDPQFISSMGWIAETWTSAFDGLGSWQSIITFPMFLGLAMLIIGRGSHAIDRGVAKVQRRQMRDEYRRNRREDDA